MWQFGGNVKTAADVDKLDVTSRLEPDAIKAQVALARKLVKQGIKVLDGEEYIVTAMGQLEPDGSPESAAGKAAQPHLPQASIAIQISTTNPLP